MKLAATEKDKQSRPVAIVDITDTEIGAIKKAEGAHPKFRAKDDPEGVRIQELFHRPPEEWRKLNNITIKDIKEVVNKYIQDTGENSVYTTLRDELHQMWKQLNPS